MVRQPAPWAARVGSFPDKSCDSDPRGVTDAPQLASRSEAADILCPKAHWILWVQVNDTDGSVYRLADVRLCMLSHL